MVNKAKPPADVLASWQAMLVESTEEVRRERVGTLRAELMQRVCIRGAFAAGLAVNPIRESTGLSIGRLYQIKAEDEDVAALLASFDAALANAS